MFAAERIRTMFVALFCLTAACDSATGPGMDVDVRAGEAALELFNASGSVAYYFVVNTELLPRINWAQCTGDGCDSVAPGERVSVSLGTPSRDGGESGMITIYWWHAVQTADGPQPGRVHVRTTSLH